MFELKYFLFNWVHQYMCQVPYVCYVVKPSHLIVVNNAVFLMRKKGTMYLSRFFNSECVANFLSSELSSICTSHVPLSVSGTNSLYVKNYTCSCIRVQLLIYLIAIQAFPTIHYSISFWSIWFRITTPTSMLWI